MLKMTHGNLSNLKFIPLQQLSQYCHFTGISDFSYRIPQSPGQTQPSVLSHVVMGTAIGY